MLLYIIWQTYNHKNGFWVVDFFLFRIIFSIPFAFIFKDKFFFLHFLVCTELGLINLNSNSVTRERESSKKKICSEEYENITREHYYWKISLGIRLNWRGFSQSHAVSFIHRGAFEWYFGHCYNCYWNGVDVIVMLQCRKDLCWGWAVHHSILVAFNEANGYFNCSLISMNY